MSAVIAQIKISDLAPGPKPIEDAVLVGKDILDLLAGSMYIDPLNIYREYIQNAADAIDEAIDAKLRFEGLPGVSIWLDPIERTIKIRDNGISIRSQDFIKRLVTIGASKKRGRKMRGFRGVGRLAGLGFCQQLIFRGRAEGESKVTELTWDGRVLRDKIRDETFSGGIAELVQAIAVTRRYSAEGFPSRFFEVELKRVLRLRNDVLLNEDVVRSYISQVAPVPFHSECSYGADIQRQLDEAGLRPPLHVILNDTAEPITHRLRDHITLSNSASDPVKGVDFFEIPGPNGEVAAVGWIADHSYLGAIPKRAGLGGIRLRSGNIQVGDELILADLFPEARFAAWAIGEIHVLSPNVLPNGRRDEFEPSVAYAHLRGELAIRLRNIAQTIRDRSGARNRAKAVHSDLNYIDAWLHAFNGKQYPRQILEVTQEMLEERLELVSKGLAKVSADMPVSTLMQKKAGLERLVGKLAPQGVKGRPKGGGLSKTFKKPVAAALRTILSNSKTPSDGLKLATEVFGAFKNSA